MAKKKIYNKEEINSKLDFSIYFKDGGKLDMSRFADMTHHLLVNEENGSSDARTVENLENNID